jgi:hypothetical protein
MARCSMARWSKSKSSCPLWQPERSHLYVGTGEDGFCARDCVHRPLKKTVFLAILAFDTLGPRTYNPRPRCFAADVANAVLPLNLDVKIVGGRCLTL